MNTNAGEIDAIEKFLCTPFRRGWHKSGRIGFLTCLFGDWKIWLIDFNCWDSMTLCCVINRATLFPVNPSGIPRHWNVTRINGRQEGGLNKRLMKEPVYYLATIIHLPSPSWSHHTSSASLPLGNGLLLFGVKYGPTPQPSQHYQKCLRNNKFNTFSSAFNGMWWLTINEAPSIGCLLGRVPNRTT